MEKYILIAGVNGAGKSTLYQTLDSLKGMKRVNTDEIAKQRIAYRVAHGGHGIPDADVERRYTESFKNLKEIKSKCDSVVLYDNTTVFNRFAVYKENELYMITDNVPNWFQKYVK